MADNQLKSALSYPANLKVMRQQRDGDKNIISQKRQIPTTEVGYTGKQIITYAS